MATHGRDRSRRHNKKQRRRVLVILTLALTAFACWQIATAFRQSQLAEARQGQREEKLALALAAKTLHPALKRVFPYSVIPGGIGSVEEMKSVVAHDSVVAAHYSGFDLNKARFIHAEAEQHVYVSYRIGDHIYWTTKKLTIQPGEVLVTDGETTARGRCGNLISAVAEKPVFSAEPAIKTFETPEEQPPEITMAERGLNPVPESGEGIVVQPLGSSAHSTGSAVVPPVLYPIGGGSGGSSTTTAVTPVPEPGTELMLLGGLGTVGWAFWLRRKNVEAANRIRR